MSSGRFSILVSFVIGLFLIRVLDSHPMKILNDRECGSRFKCNVGDEPPPEIGSAVIDLDLDPRLRWKAISEEHKEALQELLIHMENYLGKTILSLFELVVDRISKSLPDEYVDEMLGISDATGIPVIKVILFNLFNEFFSVCTSIVAIDEKNVTYHARNLDFGLFMGWNSTTNEWVVPRILRKMTMKFLWKKNGITVAESIGFVGYIGISTGLKPNLFSISLNDRFAIDGGYIGLILYLMGRTGGKFSGFIIREELLASSSYDEAVSNLMKVKLVAPGYYIVGSNKDNGAVITRSRDESDDLWSINATLGDWYVLQTNYDHWKRPPIFDDRITPGTSCMDIMGKKNVSVNGIYNVLRTIPVRNMLTVFTAIMIPSEGYLKAYLQECPYPCDPW